MAVTSQATQISAGLPIRSIRSRRGAIGQAIRATYAKVRHFSIRHPNIPTDSRLTAPSIARSGFARAILPVISIYYMSDYPPFVKVANLARSSSIDKSLRP